MKKANINININVPDNFECGDCYICPLKETKYIQVGLQEYDTQISCKLGFQKSTCPIEVLPTAEEIIKKRKEVEDWWTNYHLEHPEKLKLR